jgi:hypothetical protein
MNDFTFCCPHCGQHIESEAVWIGHETNCPACQQMLVVPSPVPPAASLPEPPPSAWTDITLAPLPVSGPPGTGNRANADDPITGEGLANPNYTITSEGLVKLDTDTTLENFLMGGAVGALVFALGAGKVALLGHRRSPPTPELLPYALGALPLALVFFIAHRFTDNYYLLDRERHRIFYHFKFLWFRRLRVLLQRKDIVAVTVQGHKASERRGPTYWEYRVGVVGTNGRWIALTEWEKEALEPCNRKAASLAAMLGCQAYSASAGCELVVRKKDRSVSIAHVPLRHGTTRSERWLCLVVGLIVLGMILYASLSM